MFEIKVYGHEMVEHGLSFLFLFSSFDYLLKLNISKQILRSAVTILRSTVLKSVVIHVYRSNQCSVL